MLSGFDRSLIDSAALVYKGYIVLNLATDPSHANRNPAFKINGKKQTLLDCIQQMQDKRINKETINVDNQNYTIEINATNKIILTKLTKETLITESNLEKPLNEYNFSDLVTLTQSYPLSIEKNPELVLSTVIRKNTKEIKLGGKDVNGENKIDLYLLHISNLWLIYQHLSQGANPHALIAMATGSGKSFTQALMFLVLYISNIKGIFTVPTQALANQLKKDFARILPKTMVDEIAQFSQEAALTENYYIATHENIFLEKWTTFKQKFIDNSERIYICVDEEHEAMKEEVLAKRIKIASNFHSFMFLSATPTKLSYDISGQKSVVKLSMQEKKALGLNKDVHLVKTTAKTLQQRLATVQQDALKRRSMFYRTNSSLRERLIAAREGLDNFLANISMKFIDMISTPSYSVAHDYFHQAYIEFKQKQPSDPYYIDPRVLNVKNASEIKRLLKYNVSQMLDENALILADKIDTIVNLSNLLQKNDNDVFTMGNKVSRARIYEFFGLSNVDETFLQKIKNGIYSLRDNYYTKYLADNGINALQTNDLIDKNIEINQMSSNKVIHGIVDNALLFITGFDLHKLDRERFNNIKDLTKLVSSKLKDASAVTAIKQTLQETLNKELGHELGRIVSNEIQSMISHLQAKTNELEMYIENWHFDYKLNAQLRDYIKANKNTQQFIENYQNVFLFNQIESNEIEIIDNRPFKGFTQTTESIHQSSNKLKRKLTTMESLDDKANFYSYKPNYLNCTEAQVDSLFKRKLIGNYITNKKVFGFNDLNLQHVVHFIESDVEKFNEADYLIQSYGRNRGLNPVRDPFYTIINGNGVNVTFDLSHMDRDDYFPTFFKAQEAFLKKKSQNIRLEIASELKKWIEKNNDIYGRVPHEKIQEHCFDLIIDKFEEIYKRNSFDFDKTRLQMRHILLDVYDELYHESSRLKELLKPSVSNKIILFILRNLSFAYFAIFAKKYKDAFNTAAQAELTNAGDRISATSLYIKILKNYSYEFVTEKRAIAKKIDIAMNKEMLKVAKFINAKPYQFMSEQGKSLINSQAQAVYLPLMTLMGLNDESLIQAIKSCDWANVLDNFSSKTQPHLPNNPQALLSFILNAAVKTSNVELKLKIEAFSKQIANFDFNNQDPSQLEALSAKVEFMLNSFENCKKFTDIPKVKEAYFRAIKRFISSKRYQNTFIDLLGKFSQNELEMLLSEIKGIDWKNNKSAKLTAKTIYDFTLMIKESKNEKDCQKILDTFLNLDANLKINDTSLSHIHHCLQKISDEMLRCLGHFYSIDSKGNFEYLLEKPHLLNNNNAIAEIIVPYRRNFLHGLCAKTKFIQAVFASFNGMNEVEATENQNVIEVMQQTAEYIILPIHDTLMDEQVNSNDKVAAFSEKIKKHRSFTLDEVSRGEIAYSNALKQFKAEFKAKLPELKATLLPAYLNDEAFVHQYKNKNLFDRINAKAKRNLKVPAKIKKHLAPLSLMAAGFIGVVSAGILGSGLIFCAIVSSLSMICIGFGYYVIKAKMNLSLLAIETKLANSDADMVKWLTDNKTDYQSGHLCKDWVPYLKSFAAPKLYINEAYQLGLKEAKQHKLPKIVSVS
ncbi:MAG: DEAD/DEAH box helicase family protein [Proteobacteria bacterium]|nr:DEAD/DEAH box helicase family protein [Pseudomonadota bacterium]